MYRFFFSFSLLLLMLSPCFKLFDYFSLLDELGKKECNRYRESGK